jgi:23S rRNA (uracil1939-C5)-methyltransferase
VAIELKVEKLAHGGLGIARAGQTVVFVPYSAPGDYLRVAVHSQRRNYWTARIVDIIEPSPLRVAPQCPYYRRCGGCDFQHLSYPGQLAAKSQAVAEALQRIAHVAIQPEAPAPALRQWRYRNKAQYPLGGPPWRVGYYERQSHNVVDIQSCLVQPEGFDRLLPDLRTVLAGSTLTAWDEATGQGNLRHIVLRGGAATGELLLTYVGAARPRRGEMPARLHHETRGRHSALVGILYNPNPARTNRILGTEYQVLAGIGSYRERLHGRELRISAASFFQANTGAAEILVRAVLDLLGAGPHQHILELFGGVGTITLSLSSVARRVTSVEDNPVAADDARYNVQANGLDNVEVITADAEQMPARLAGIDAVVLDPPRRGCTAELLRGIVGLAPRVIVYVSCNPATLARDLVVLKESGYEPERVRLVDMFPQTSHIETVTRIVPAGR